MKTPEKFDNISYEDFMRVDIRVGKIISVKDNEKSFEPSYIIDIDFGENIGVLQSSCALPEYEISELNNKLVLCIINLPGRNIHGYKSNAFILNCNDKEENLSLISIDKDVPLGSKVFINQK